MKKYQITITFLDRDYDDPIFAGIEGQDFDYKTFPISLKTVYKHLKFLEEESDWSVPYPKVEKIEVEPTVDDKLLDLRILENDLELDALLELNR